MNKVTLEDIHECLVGNKLAGQKGLIDKVDELNEKLCVVQNQAHTLMKDREKNKNKITLTIPKWLTAVIGIAVKTKTGI